MKVFTAARGLSLAVASRGYSLVVAHGLLLVIASLVAEHLLYWALKHGLSSCGTWAFFS